LADSKKAYVKLMESIEKQRKMLSGNLESDINIEYLMEDNDLNYCMKREKFEELATPILDEVKRVLIKVR
jgi:molecular chaperone DnaK (HSP70)